MNLENLKSRHFCKHCKINDAGLVENMKEWVEGWLKIGWVNFLFVGIISYFLIFSILSSLSFELVLFGFLF